MSKKVKILVVTLSLPTKFHEGSGIFILNQLEYLKDKCDIKILCPYPYVPSFKFLNPYYRFSEVPHKDMIKGMEVYRPRYFMLPRNKVTLKFMNILLIIEAIFLFKKSKEIIKNLAKKWDFDIIHSHELISGAFIADYCKKKYNKPLVITLHGEDITRYSKMMFLRSISKFSFRLADKIIAVSKSLRNEVYAAGLSKKKIEIIPSGYHVGRFKPRNTGKCRDILELPKNKKIILFVGGLEKRKGVEYLIKALGILTRKMQNFVCYIVGIGSLEKHLIGITKKLGLRKNVIFVGRKSPDEVPVWMNACDVLVLPSLNEGLPNVISEALACGKPVVATKVAGTPELVNKDVGYLVKPKDVNALAEKISLALNKKWEKDKLLKRAREFNVTNSVKKLIEVYKIYKKK